MAVTTVELMAAQMAQLWADKSVVQRGVWWAARRAARKVDYWADLSV